LSTLAGEVQLIEKGADVNTKTDEGFTALWAAEKFKYNDIAQLLAKAGAKE